MRNYISTCAILLLTSSPALSQGTSIETAKAEARRIGGILGLASVVSPEPKQHLQENSRYGTTIHSFSWFPAVPPNAASIRIDVDEHRNMTVAFDCLTWYSENENSSNSNAMETISESQALATAERLFQNIGISGDWRLRFCEKYNAPVQYRNYIQWSILKIQYHEGYQINDSSLDCTISPFDGKIISFQRTEPIKPQFLSGGFPLLDSTTLESIARQHFESYAGRPISSSDRFHLYQTCWCPLDSYPGCYRLAYNCGYGAIHPGEEDDLQAAWFIDAETGETLAAVLPRSIQPRTRSSKAPKSVSHRQEMIRSLSPKGRLEPLSEALLRGKPVPPGKDERSARAFVRNVPGEVLTFRWDAKKRILSWKHRGKAEAVLVPSPARQKLDALTR